MYVIIRSFFYDKKNKVKTKFIRLLIVALLLFVFCAIFWGSFIHPRKFVTKVVEINLNKTEETENIKIAFLTDLHLGPYKQKGYLKKVMTEVDSYNPDLILFGGDFLYDEEKEARFLAPLINWANKYPIYAVTGNHEFSTGKYGDPKYKDKTQLLRFQFKNWNIKILDNESEEIIITGHKLSISGIEDLWTGRASLEPIIEKIDESEINILLSHNPDIILDTQHEKFDLILSGHTHAGQIRLPWVGSIPNIPTELGRAYDQGLFKLKNGQLYISAGLGESGVRARFFNPPELTIINLDL